MGCCDLERCEKCSADSTELKKELETAYEAVEIATNIAAALLKEHDQEQARRREHIEALKEQMRLLEKARCPEDQVPATTDADAFITRQELAEENQRLRDALKEARASFLGLQPDFGGPVSRQMASAIARINRALEH